MTPQSNIADSGEGPLHGKVAWVTGAGSGIGRAIAERFAQAGALVALTGRNHEALHAVAESIGKSGGRAEVWPCDVAEAAEVRDISGSILRALGTVNILVNNAGLNVAERHWADVSIESWDRLVAVNLNATFYCTQAVLPEMRRNRDGLVIHIASWFGRYASYAAGPGYGAAKHAVMSLSESLNREECVNGVRSCAICPGEVATPALSRRAVPPTSEQLGRMLQSGDIAAAALFVAQMPASACVNELVLSPTWNRVILGAGDLKEPD